MIVENNLFGMDLDERAAQISQIALFIKLVNLVVIVVTGQNIQML